MRQAELHYDLRLELGGVLKSWAVPKGPSLDPRVKSLAVHVEDHPIEYGSFEGVIPQGQYGGGTVMLWDRGTWEHDGDAAESYEKGKLVFRLAGERLKGRWALIRMGGKAGQNGKNWLLKKLEDDEARSAGDQDVLKNETSVATGHTMEEIANNKQVPSARRGKADQNPGSTSGSRRPDTPVSKPASARKVDPSRLSGARRSPLPARIAPELPSLVDKLPEDEAWLYELKLDGYRMICVVRDGTVALLTRRGNNWTHRFPTIARGIEMLGLESAIVDGEVVVLRKDGSTDFQALQNLLRQGNDHQLVYFVFDLLYYRCHDLRSHCLERKEMLSRIFAGAGDPGTIRYNDHIVGHGDQVFFGACGHGLEGIVAKRADSQYTEGRTADWVKIKCLKRQEFVVGGWTEPAGSRNALGALLVGYYRKHSELIYCGRVGTGFSHLSLRELRGGFDRSKASDRHSPGVSPALKHAVSSTGPSLNSLSKSHSPHGRQMGFSDTPRLQESGRIKCHTRSASNSLWRNRTRPRTILLMIRPCEGSTRHPAREPRSGHDGSRRMSLRVWPDSSGSDSLPG